MTHYLASQRSLSLRSPRCEEWRPGGISLFDHVQPAAIDARAFEEQENGLACAVYLFKSHLCGGGFARVVTRITQTFSRP